MPAFVFANIQSVSDPARFAEYQRLAEPTVIQYGGKFLAGAQRSKSAMAIGRLWALWSRNS